MCLIWRVGTVHWEHLFHSPLGVFSCQDSLGGVRLLHRVNGVQAAPTAVVAAAPATMPAVVVVAVMVGGAPVGVVFRPARL